MAGLMQDQQDAADKFQQCLNNTDTTFMGLWASAGFGKSWVAKHLIREIIMKRSNFRPVLASMTHSAAQVLSDFVGMEVNTLHATLGWRPIANKDTGEESIETPYMRDKEAEHVLKAGDILVIDEAGLLGSKEVALLKAECNATGARVLFIGDSKQCFPVGDMCVPAYDITDFYLELTIPKRADKDNTIYKLSEQLRACVDGAKRPKLVTALNPDKSGVRVVDDIEELAIMAFKAGVRDGYTKDIKVLAFTNERCLTLNRKIRKKVLGLSDPTPLVGEEMVANTTITQMDGEEVIIKNNQIVYVVSVEKTDSHGMPGAFIQFKDEKGENIEGIVFVPASPSKLKTRLHQIAEEASEHREEKRDEQATAAWNKYYNLKEGCADIRFTYAITVNKAQGITLKHCLMDLTNIDVCGHKEQNARLAYTAATRPHTFLTIET